MLDLLTIRTLVSHRRRPRVPFGFIAPLALLVSLFFLTAWLIAVFAFQPEKAESLVFPAAALLSAGTAFFLMMLGLMAEVALVLHGRRSEVGMIVKEIDP